MICTIKRLDDYGRGIAIIDNKITFINNSLIGEVIEYKIVKEKKNYNIGEVVDFVSISDSRNEYSCPYYNKCGGCNIAHMKYDYENNFKVNKVKNILNKFAKIQVDNLEIVYDTETYYRNKITLHVNNNNELGLLEENSNNIVPISKCLITNKEINKIIEVLKKLIIKENINKIIIRCGNKTDEILLSLYGNVRDINSFKNISNSLYINDKKITNSYITSYIGDKKFHIRNNSFFQVNDNICKKLYDEILNIINDKKPKKVLDLYCGVGSIGIYISDNVEEVLGIEVVENAIIDANENKKLNNISNIKFINNKVENVIDSIKDYDMVIVDPPRSGLDNKTINSLINIKSKNIIYVSCDPITLARDLNVLKEKYNIQYIKLFNMFPRTSHCESVCILERR